MSKSVGGFFIMRKVIHINQHHIKHNYKNKDKKPVITIKTYKENKYANWVSINDRFGEEVAKVIYSPEKPLSCGARVWIETSADIECSLEIPPTACPTKKSKSSLTACKTKK